MSLQPILPVTEPINKMKGAVRQCYGDGDGVVRCEQALLSLNADAHVRSYHSRWSNKTFIQNLLTPNDMKMIKISVNLKNVRIAPCLPVCLFVYLSIVTFIPVDQFACLVARQSYLCG